MEETKEIVILTESQKAAAKLSKVAGDIAKVTEGLNTYVEQVSDLTDAVNVKTVELQKLEDNHKQRLKEIAAEAAEKTEKMKSDFKEARRTAQVNTDLDIKEDETKAVQKLLEKRNEVAVPAGTVEELQEKLETISEDNQDAIDKAVNAEKAAGERKMKAALETAQLTYKAETADKDAKLEAALATIESLKEQVASSKTQVSEMRETMQAAITGQTAPTINVGGK